MRVSEGPDTFEFRSPHGMKAASLFDIAQSYCLHKCCGNVSSSADGMFA